MSVVCSESLNQLPIPDSVSALSTLAVTVVIIESAGLPVVPRSEVARLNSSIQ